MVNFYSLQGSMAVGKTTALNYIKNNRPEINCSFEDNNKIVQEIRKRHLQKNKVTLMDFGTEEIEFHTLFYPKTIGKAWDIESLLKKKLAYLRRYQPKRILFLNASYKTLTRNKNNDSLRSRNSFDEYYQNMLPLKLKWFKNRQNVDFIDIDQLSSNEVGDICLDWLDQQKE